MKDKIKVNVELIPPEIQFQLAKGCMELYHSIVDQPGGREKLDAWKAAHPYKRKVQSKTNQETSKGGEQDERLPQTDF